MCLKATVGRIFPRAASTTISIALPPASAQSICGYSFTDTTPSSRSVSSLLILPCKSKEAVIGMLRPTILRMELTRSVSRSSISSDTAAPCSDKQMPSILSFTLVSAFRMFSFMFLYVSGRTGPPTLKTESPCTNSTPSSSALRSIPDI